MKRVVRILRIVACAAVSLYTVYTCYLCGQMAYTCCMDIRIDESGAYYAAVSGITREAVPYIAVAAVLLLLGIASVVLMFRRGWLAAILSGATAVATAILGMCTNTMLCEIMFARYTLGVARSSRGADAWILFKPMTALFCICAAVGYVILYFIAYRQQRRRGGVEEAGGNCG